MGAKIVKLKFTSPVHFGEGRLTDGRITCDASTLFSALFIEALNMSCQNELVEATRANNLLLSDLFPFIGDDYYLPKPVAHDSARDTLASTEANADVRVRKAFKKLKFIKSSKFDNYMAGSFDPIHELAAFNLGESSLSTKVNLERSESDDAKPYSIGEYSFNPGTGLYFLTQGTYDITPLLEQLQYSGLGGKRSIGYGRFSYEIAPAAPFEQFNFGGNNQSDASGKRWLLLSSAAPKEAELTDDLLSEAAYAVRRRGGFIQSVSHAAMPQKKRDLYVFDSGSTFSQRFEGDVFDVNNTPGAHPVYSYARAMWMEVQ